MRYCPVTFNCNLLRVTGIVTNHTASHLPSNNRGRSCPRNSISAALLSKCSQSQHTRQEGATFDLPVAPALLRFDSLRSFPPSLDQFIFSQPPLDFDFNLVNTSPISSRYAALVYILFSFPPYIYLYLVLAALLPARLLIPYIVSAAASLLLLFPSPLRDHQISTNQSHVYSTTHTRRAPVVQQIKNYTTPVALRKPSAPIESPLPKQKLRTRACWKSGERTTCFPHAVAIRSNAMRCDSTMKFEFLGAF
ncbi:hypothetical protein BT63DRAFT_257127 [Microthyrium microscopicum]|uniref:Uncharacterized protein n=1 Tax=Microthyrium microscopicum TaxID=703497 RepID=A0A6A6UDY0_9PEZI|nr:hypothetical protein BT63DRAFT_257127 [Microthyrium microscopicum]